MTAALSAAVGGCGRASRPTSRRPSPRRPARRRRQARRRPQAGRGDRLLRHEAGLDGRRLHPRHRLLRPHLPGVVGPKGRVYAFYPSRDRQLPQGRAAAADGHDAVAGAPNVTALVAPANEFAAPAPLDLVWISDNYHDLHDPFFAPADLAKVNAAVFKALKPGGIYLIVDQRAEAGSGLARHQHAAPHRRGGGEERGGGGRLPAGRRERRAANPADKHTLRSSIPRSAATPTSSS